MHLPVLTTLLTSALSFLSVSAHVPYKLHCYQHGAYLGDYNEIAAKYAAESCNHTFGNREYQKLQIVRDCRSFHINLRLDMRVELLTFPSRNLSVEECYVRMWKIVNCLKGGYYRDKNWVYVLDPNVGGAC